ncbi:MAG: hypothetical protein ACYC1Q_03055 [Bacteroidia bacterium]
MKPFQNTKNYSWLFFLSILIACGTESSQTKNIESTEKLNELDQFIPEGHIIHTHFKNDMNLDSTDDIVLILEIDTSLHDTLLIELFGTNYREDLAVSRPFLILIRQKNGELKLAAKNDMLYSASTTRWVLFSAYFPEPEVSDGQFGYTGFFFHGGGGHSESDIRFEYSPEHSDWLLMEARYSYTSDTPTEEGGYDNHEGSYHKTQKDFGIIGINEFDGSLD